MDGNFVLGQDISGNPYVDKSIQALAGQNVEPVGFVIRKNDPKRSVQVVIGDSQPLSLNHFSQHPPEEILRASAEVI